jgi:putative tricarboxylic transport membrane protein
MPRSPEARRDFLSAGGLAALAITYLAANRAYPLDSLATPGPGVFPLAAGTLLLGAAVGQAVAAARARPATASRPADGPADRRVLALMAVLVVYPIAAAAIGFLTASFTVVLASSRLLGTRDWLRAAVLALGVTAAAHVLFVAWLGVPLPSGPLP